MNTHEPLDITTVQIAAILQDLAINAPQLTADDAIYDAILEAVLGIFPADRVAIMEVRRPRAEDRLNAIFHWGAPIDTAIVSDPSLKPRRDSWSLDRQTVVNFVDGMDNAVDQSFFDWGFRQAVVTPVIIDRSNQFTLNVFSKQEQAFQDQHLKAIEAIAGMMGLMLAGSKLRREVQLQVWEAELLAETGRLMGDSASPQDMVDHITRQVAIAFNCCGMSFVYRDGSWTPWTFAQTPEWNTWSTRLIESFTAHLPVVVAREASSFFNMEDRLADLMEQVRVQAREISSTSMVEAIPFDGHAAWIIVAIRPETAGESAFAPGDEGIFQKLTHYVTPFWGNANLNEEMGRTSTERDALRRLSEVLNSARDSASRLPIITRTAHLLFGSDFVSVQTFEGEVVRPLYQGGTLHHGPNRRGEIVPSLDEVVPLATRTLDILDIRTPGDLNGRPLHRAEQLRSSVVAPFIFTSGEHGSLLLGFRSHHWFTFAEARFARLLADAIGSSIALTEPPA